MSFSRGSSDHGDYINGLWKAYVKDREPGVRAKLFEQYLGLVHHAARDIKQTVHGSLDLEDLIGAGTLGLVQALEAFDPYRGFAFSSFAVPRIRGAILDEIRSWDWVPRSVRDRNRSVKRVTADLRQKLGREPEPAEIAEGMEWDMETYWRYAADLKDPVVLPFDSPARGEDGDPSLAETLADESTPDVTAALVGAETVDQLQVAFNTLSQRDRMVLTLSYFEKLTLKEIGEVLNVSESRISQIRTRAIRRLTERMHIEEEAA